MPEPRWIHEALAYAIHHRQIAEHGGLEGVRDRGGLESALERAKSRYGYTEDTADLATLAAAYAFGIARNHPFADGNKRTALVICRTFLLLNGQDLVASQEEKYWAFRQLAEVALAEDELAEWIEHHSPLSPQPTLTTCYQNSDTEDPSGERGIAAGCEHILDEWRGSYCPQTLAFPRCVRSCHPKIETSG